MRFSRRGILVLVCGVLWISAVQAQQLGFTQEDRERIERNFAQMDKRMSRIETTLEMFMKSTDQRFETMQKSMDRRFEELRTDMDRRFGEQREDMNKRFETMQKSIDKRFEQVDKRFEQVDKRFEQVHRQLEQMLLTFQIFAGIFAALIIAVIGFALWDRRTIVSKAQEVTLEALAKEEGLKKSALIEQVVAEVLRRIELQKRTPPQSPVLSATA